MFKPFILYILKTAIEVTFGHLPRQTAAQYAEDTRNWEGDDNGVHILQLPYPGVRRKVRNQVCRAEEDPAKPDDR
jgi:hypothetical protein